MVAERKYQFEWLTPTDNIDLDVYEEAINYVFENPDVKNVAISGAYSAGKSSVLASYKKKHDDLRFLHISLAHFKSPDQEVEMVATKSDRTKQNNNNYFIMVDMWDIFHYNKIKEELKGM